MITSRRSSTEQVARLLKRCLREGKTVEIDSLGLFRPNGDGTYEFRAYAMPRLFLAYVQEDAPIVDRLFEEFRAYGFDPWLDRKRLLPGQNWPRSIEEAIETCDFFVACFSQRSVSKKGGFQAEIRYALDCARHVPLDEIFLIPVRLDECRVPARVRNEIQYIDLFPDWGKGLRRIAGVIQKQMRRHRN